MRDAGLVVGVISNSNGSVQLALERARLGPLGAQRAGLHAVLFDPGGLVGDRGCPAAPGLVAAVELALS